MIFYHERLHDGSKKLMFGLINLFYIYLTMCVFFPMTGAKIIYVIGRALLVNVALIERKKKKLYCAIDYYQELD